MRSLHASLVVLALVPALLVPVAAAAAEGDGTIAYALDGEIWIADPDGSERRQVTSGSGPWSNPSISDNGVIVAQRGDGTVVRMNSGGTELSTFDPPQEVGGIDHVVVQPNGQNVAYTTGCVEGEEFCYDEYTRIAYADGRQPGVRAEGYVYAPPSWMRDGSGLVVQADTSIWTFGVQGPGQTYYPDHGEDGGPSVLSTEHAAATPDGRVVAVAGLYYEYDEDFNEIEFARISFYDLQTAVEGDVAPTGCRIEYDPATEVPGAISFGPDGRSLVVEVLTRDAGDPLRIDVVDGITPASCAGASPQTFVDGATDPFWSTVDYADLPDDPGAADPELPEPTPLTGTLAYIKDGQVWLSEPDGSAAQQITEGGSWGSPSIAADGTILASYSEDPDGVRTALVRLTPDGQVTAFVPDLLLAGGIGDAAISPDGQYAAYDTAEFCTGSDGRIFVCDSVVIVWADGRTTEPLGEGILDSGVAWYPGSHTVITGDGNLVQIGSEDSEPWFSSNSYNSGDPSVSADGSTLALTGTIAATLATMSGPPPAEAVEHGSCEILYEEESTQRIYSGALSPDGHAFAYTLYDEEEELGQGDLWIATGLEAADCSVTPLYEETQLVAGGVRDPFWSPLAYDQLLGGGPTTPGGGGAGSVPPSPDAERNPIQYAIAVSQGRFDDAAATRQGGRQAAHVVLARVDVFADALGGSALTADAPLLFTGRDALDPATAAEIDRVLGGSGTVYLLGQTGALSAEVEQALAAAGYTPRRLAGPSRVETAIAVADEAVRLYGEPTTVAVARADSPPENPTAAWADSISAGAWAAETGQPILLTQTGSAHPAVAAWLQPRSADVVFLGGPGAVSDQAAAGLATPVVRAAGSNRFSTAAAIADQLWPSTASGFAVGNGAAPDAWSYDLAAAGLAADLDQPLLLTEAGRLPDETAAALGCPRAAVTVIGTPTLITPEVQAQITSC